MVAHFRTVRRLTVKEICKKISKVCKMIFGYSIMITLFVGGLTFLGFAAALVIGGNTAQLICDVIYNRILPVVIYISTSTVLFGLLSMYLAGEMALTSSGKKASKSEGKR